MSRKKHQAGQDSYLIITECSQLYSWNLIKDVEDKMVVHYSNQKHIRIGKMVKITSEYALHPLQWCDKTKSLYTLILTLGWDKTFWFVQHYFKRSCIKLDHVSRHGEWLQWLIIAGAKSAYYAAVVSC